MSVLKRNRKESTLEFINTAIELEVFILKECSKFPKRYFYIITKDIIALSKEMLINLRLANDIFPNNKENIDLRKQYFTKALYSIDILYIQIDVINRLFTVKETFMKELMELLVKEENLIKKIIISDKNRLK